MQPLLPAKRPSLLHSISVRPNKGMAASVGDFLTRVHYVNAYDCRHGLYKHRKRVCTGSGLCENQHTRELISV